MLVKILDADRDFVETLKAITGETTASKAFETAAARYVRLLEDNRHVTGLAHRQHVEIQRLRGILDGARHAAALLLEDVGQDDLFADQVNGRDPGSS